MKRELFSSPYRKTVIPGSSILRCKLHQAPAFFSQTKFKPGPALKLKTEKCHRFCGLCQFRFPEEFEFTSDPAKKTPE